VENRKISLHQPNFLPWLGFFDKMAKSDVFVIFDDVQFPRGKTYTSRTRIVNGEPRWLTVPIKKKSRMLKINETEIDNTQAWAEKHWRAIEATYQKAPVWGKPNPYFKDIGPFFKVLYEIPEDSLLQLNMKFIIFIKNLFKIDTPIEYSSSVGNSELQGLDRIIDIVKSLGGDTYITGNGVGSQRYVEPERFAAEGIKLEYQKFKHPVYYQRGWDDFVPGASSIDALFNEGRKAAGLIA